MAERTECPVHGLDCYGCVNEITIIDDTPDEDACMLAGYHLVGTNHDRDECPTEVEDDASEQDPAEDASYWRESWDEGDWRAAG